MQAVYEWVGDIVSYLIFITVLTGILPTAKYEKYIRLFAGCILILLVFRPLTGSLRLEDKINGLFQSISFENEAGELRGQQEEIERKRLDRLVDAYEETAAQEMIRMAEEEGYSVRCAEIQIERNEESGSFGKIKSAVLEVRDAAEAGALQSGMSKSDLHTDRSSGLTIAVEAVESVDPVRLGGDGKEGADSGGGPGTASEPFPVSELRKRIASYYQMEAEHVEIRVED